MSKEVQLLSQHATHTHTHTHIHSYIQGTTTCPFFLPIASYLFLFFKLVSYFFAWLQTWPEELDLKLLSEWPLSFVTSCAPPPLEPHVFFLLNLPLFYDVIALLVSVVSLLPLPPECSRTTNPNSGYKLQTCLWQGSACSPLCELLQQTQLSSLAGA